MERSARLVPLPAESDDSVIEMVDPKGRDMKEDYDLVPVRNVSSPFWKLFKKFSVLSHPEKKDKAICMIDTCCKILKVASSTGGLSRHFNQNIETSMRNARN